MNGLEKIIQKIEQDNKTECEAIVGSANAQANEILEKAAKESSQIYREILDTAIKENEKETTYINSKAELDRKKSVLTLKNDIVSDIIKTALNSLKESPDAEYFKTVASLVPKYAQKGSGMLCFSKRDLERLPEGYESLLNKELRDGFSLKISDEPVDIDGGFILVYGDVEQNCSFDSLLASSIDKIKDLLYEKLFKRDSL
jgi:V/A-type H+-transporting ATPase subunit E